MFESDDCEFWTEKIEQAIGVTPEFVWGSQRRIVFYFDINDVEYHFSVEADDLICNVDCGLPAAVGTFNEIMRWVHERAAA